MLSGRWKISIVAGCFSFLSVAATAQEVVHALSGTVNQVDLNTKTLSVLTDDGSDGAFRDLANPRTSLEFDKNLRTEATAAGEFNQSGVRAVVYYYGSGVRRTAVAVRSLGAGPFTRCVGTVVKFDKGGRSLSIADGSGAIQTFKITKDTVAETDSGVAEGLKFEPRKGERVRVVADKASGDQTAEFINESLSSGS